MRASDYPVRVGSNEDEGINRLWGIPVVGTSCAGAIPHYIVLTRRAFGVFPVVLVSWIPVVIGGRMASWGYAMLGGWLRWTTRVNAYVLLLTSDYPPFRLRD